MVIALGELSYIYFVLPDTPPRFEVVPRNALGFVVIVVHQYFRDSGCLSSHSVLGFLGFSWGSWFLWGSWFS